MGEVLDSEGHVVQGVVPEELMADEIVEENTASSVTIVERDEVEFRVIDSFNENLESKVLNQDDSLDHIVTSGSTITGDNPLDVQSRYITESESTTPYFSYDTQYEVKGRDDITVAVESDADRIRSVTSEIMLKKVHSIAGGSHTQMYSNEHQQAQMDWYKRVNTFFLMFLYDVT